MNILNIFSPSVSPAYIPTPIYFGAVIDTTCMLWQQDCGFHGSCWEYDVTSLRFVYFGLAASLKFLGFLFIFLTWYSLKQHEEQTQTHTHTLFPLDTVSHLICHAGGHKGHARTRSCPVFLPRPVEHSHAAMPTGHALSRGNSCPGNGLKAITPPIRSLGGGQKVAVWGREPCTHTHTHTLIHMHETSYDYEGRLCKWKHTTPLSHCWCLFLNTHTNTFQRHIITGFLWSTD